MIYLGLASRRIRKESEERREREDRRERERIERRKRVEKREETERKKREERKKRVERRGNEGNEEERRENEEERRGSEEGRRRNDEERRWYEEEEKGSDNDGDETEIIPEQFKSSSNTLEICNWLVDKRQDILNLACQMFEAKKSVSLLPTNSSYSSASSKIQQVKHIALAYLLLFFIINIF